MRIAIIGPGISGLGAAYPLAPARFAIPAAREYGAQVAGLTISASPTELARRTAAAAGVADREAAFRVRALRNRQLVPARPFNEAPAS